MPRVKRVRCLFCQGLMLPAQAEHHHCPRATSIELPPELSALALEAMRTQSEMPEAVKEYIVSKASEHVRKGLN